MKLYTNRPPSSPTTVVVEVSFGFSKGDDSDKESINKVIMIIIMYHYLICFTICFIVCPTSTLTA